MEMLLRQKYFFNILRAECNIVFSIWNSICQPEELLSVAQVAESLY